VSQHSSLTLERWQSFDRHRQVLMIANEMHRGSRLTDPKALERCYERVLRLVDLTVQCDHRLAFRRELLRWRDGIAELYLAARGVGADPGSSAAHRTDTVLGRSGSSHSQLLRCLLLSSTEGARQRAFLS
jgi:hypothetical protein